MRSFVLAAAMLIPAIAAADPLDEVNLQRRNLGLPPLVRDPYLMKCAQAKAEFIAAHHVSLQNGHEGHEGPLMPPGYIEGCGVATADWGWVSCAMRTLGSHPAGAGLAIGTDGKRYMCLIIRGRSLPETNIRRSVIDTSHLSPRPPRIPFLGRIRRGDYSFGRLRPKS